MAPTTASMAVNVKQILRIGSSLSEHPMGRFDSNIGRRALAIKLSTS
jgi:hypothetical protein